jgi:DNA-binding transcriptional LysR family regulator
MSDLRRFEVFRAVATAGSFTRAAADLRVSQPAISRTVRDLERSVGVPLFHRTTRSVTLTPEGTELLAVAADVLARYDGAMDRFAAYCRGDRGSLVIAALPSVAAALLPALLSRLRADHPAIDVEVLDVTAAEATAHLRTGRADLAIAEPPPVHDDLDIQILRLDPVRAVLPARHRLSSGQPVTWAALAAEPFIALGHGSSVRRLTDRAFAQAGAAPTSLLETRNIATAGAMVEAGLGVSALPELVLPLLAFAPVVTRELRDPPVAREIAVITRTGGSVAPPARRFRALLGSDAPAVPG